MNAIEPSPRRATARDMAYFQNPRLWPRYPFLPVRRHNPVTGDCQLGLLYDAHGISGTWLLGQGLSGQSLWCANPAQMRVRHV